MKWLLILFLGIVIVPALAQNTTINQTEYQKLTNSINGIHSDYQKLESYVNKTNSELKNIYQNLSWNINETRDELHNESGMSVFGSFWFALIPFIGTMIIAVIIARKQKRQSDVIARNTDEVNTLTHEIRDMIAKQNTLLRDKQSVFADSIIQWLNGDVLDIDEFMQTWYPQYQSASGTEKDDIGKNITSVYKFHLQTRMIPIKSIDLVEIFGKEISNNWLKLWIKCMIDTELFPNDPDGIQALKENFDKIVEQAKNLKQKLEPFASSTS